MCVIVHIQTGRLKLFQQVACKCFFSAFITVFVTVHKPRVEASPAELRIPEYITRESTAGCEQYERGDYTLRQSACNVTAFSHIYGFWGKLTLKVLVATINAHLEGMGDVGSARYELALLLLCRP